VAAYALSAAESADGPITCFGSAVREKFDICPVDDKLCSPDLQTGSADGVLLIHSGGDVGLLRYDRAAAVENHKDISASGVPSVLATAGVSAVAMAEQPWNSELIGAVALLFQECH